MRHENTRIVLIRCKYLLNHQSSSSLPYSTKPSPPTAPLGCAFSSGCVGFFTSAITGSLEPASSTEPLLSLFPSLFEFDTATFSAPELVLRTFKPKLVFVVVAAACADSFRLRFFHPPNSASTLSSSVGLLLSSAATLLGRSASDCSRRNSSSWLCSSRWRSASARRSSATTESYHS